MGSEPDLTWGRSGLPDRTKSGHQCVCVCGGGGDASQHRIDTGNRRPLGCTCDWRPIAALTGVRFRKIGQKVAKVKVTGPFRGQTVAADIIEGIATEGDEVRAD